MYRTDSKMESKTYIHAYVCVYIYIDYPRFVLFVCKDANSLCIDTLFCLFVKITIYIPAECVPHSTHEKMDPSRGCPLRPAKQRRAEK